MGLRRAVYGPLVDKGQMGRLFQELKRLLGDRGTERLMVFQRAYRVVALITSILERMRLALEQSTATTGESARMWAGPSTSKGAVRGGTSSRCPVLRKRVENAGFRQLSFRGARCRNIELPVRAPGRRRRAPR